MKSIADVFKNARVIPVLVIENTDHAVPLAECLMEGGLSVIEITLRTRTAFDAVKAIKKAINSCVVGVGSILRQSEILESQRLGACFGVAPGFTTDLLQAAMQSDWPFLPGSGTASEIMLLQEKGFLYQKLFPASCLGGVAYIKAMGGPFPKIKFCPTGGITKETTPDYLALDNVFAVGCSWIAPKELINKGDWTEIRKRASLASKM